MMTKMIMNMCKHRECSQENAVANEHDHDHNHDYGRNDNHDGDGDENHTDDYDDVSDNNHDDGHGRSDYDAEHHRNHCDHNIDMR